MKILIFFLVVLSVIGIIQTASISKESEDSKLENEKPLTKRHIIRRFGQTLAGNGPFSGLNGGAGASTGVSASGDVSGATIANNRPFLSHLFNNNNAGTGGIGAGGGVGVGGGGGFFHGLFPGLGNFGNQQGLQGGNGPFSGFHLAQRPFFNGFAAGNGNLAGQGQGGLGRFTPVGIASYAGLGGNQQGFVGSPQPGIGGFAPQTVALLGRQPAFDNFDPFKPAEHEQILMANNHNYLLPDSNYNANLFPNEIFSFGATGYPNY